MRRQAYSITAVALPLALAALTLSGTGTEVYAQASGMGAPASKVEITIKDRQHGYETVGLTMPSHDTVIVVRNQDTVTHGFASNLFKGIPVRMEGGVEVVGKNFKSFHVDPGEGHDAPLLDCAVEVRSGDWWGREPALCPLV